MGELSSQALEKGPNPIIQEELRLTILDQMELTLPAASKQSRHDREAICRLNLKAKEGLSIVF